MAAPPETAERAAALDPGRRPRMWRWGVLALAAVVVATVVTVLGTGIGRDPSIVSSRLVGRSAPPLAGPTLDGRGFDLAEQRGSVVLVNVWASWCGPCREEHPLLVEASRDLASRGLVVVGVNTKDNAADARAFLREMGGAPYRSVDDREGRHAVEWATFGVPETFVVDRRGIVRAHIAGGVSAQWIDQNVVPLLAG